MMANENVSVNRSSTWKMILALMIGSLVGFLILLLSVQTYGETVQRNVSMYTDVDTVYCTESVEYIGFMPIPEFMRTYKGAFDKCPANDENEYSSQDTMPLKVTVFGVFKLYTGTDKPITAYGNEYSTSMNPKTAVDKSLKGETADTTDNEFEW